MGKMSTLRTGKKIVDLSSYISLETMSFFVDLTHLQTVLLLVCHGSTVLACSLSEFRGYLGLVYSLLVPVVDGAEVRLFLFLRSLMFEGGTTQGHIPRGLGDVLRNMRVDVPGSIISCDI